jgi:hypothetical protein
MRTTTMRRGKRGRVTWLGINNSKAKVSCDTRMWALIGLI